MPHKIPSIRLDEFFYHLPSDKIAIRPLAVRDQSKLLVFWCKGARVEHRQFSELAMYLPENSLLVMNSSKVVAARLMLLKQTGGEVEVLLTQPSDATEHPDQLLESTKPSEWQCLIGGKNVHEGAVLTSADKILTAEVMAKHGPEAMVRLSWSSPMPLSEILKVEGVIPLPPYIKRAAEPDDTVRYQTVYAKQEGSVAAPTAGLHLTDEVFADVTARNITKAEVVLHVGLGTFKTVEVADVKDHTMHAEQFEVSYVELERLLRHLKSDVPFITAVGTTTVRTLESVHWFGCSVIVEGALHNGLIEVDQWSAFNPDYGSITASESIQAVLDFMTRNAMQQLWGVTKLIIAPGAKIAVVNALITNFHHPGNTLLLLVAAFVGAENWRDIYEQALQNDYRFLSYGDSSLLVRS